jgi:hypothetical protein
MSYNLPGFPDEPGSSIDSEFIPLSSDRTADFFNPDPLIIFNRFFGLNGPFKKIQFIKKL